MNKLNHIAFIMDGNGRWGKKRNKSRNFGHLKGVEIVKKMFLQGKPATQENIFHMKRELGDIIWYWATACMALNLDPYEVISENKSKLEARYGKGFKVEKSEHRKKGDL